MMRFRLALVLLASSFVAAAQGPGRYAIASAHPLATAAGEEVLQAGGNAFDAAVAITAALAVVEPAGSGLGGGGFYLLHQAESGKKIFIDAREVAPLDSKSDMFVDAAGEVMRDALRASPLAAGIPGIPAALEHLTKVYGSKPLEDLLQPAIRHAKDGFAVDSKLAYNLDRRKADLLLHPSSRKIFLADGKPLQEGQRLVQSDLAATLERMSIFGAAGFYQGKVADQLVASVRAAGGIWSPRDLAQYAVKERNPLILEHQGWQIVTAPPPSSGGLVLGEVFNILGGYSRPLSRVNYTHLSIEAMRRAYFDRARFMGDPDFVEVPSRGLLSEDYARAWRESINPNTATRSAEFVLPAKTQEGQNTTHFSVIDAAGNRVAATLSINYLLGSAFVAEGTGVLLNNEMDDFVAKPGEANAYGLVGGQANAIEPGKRMLSSMTPTFVEGANIVAVLGTPGGSRIITMVLQGIDSIIAGESAAQVVGKPRYHHQYLPDEVQFETGAFNATEQTLLAQRGHNLVELDYRYGNMQAVIWDRKTDRLDAAADPRGVGAAVVGK